MTTRRLMYVTALGIGVIFFLSYREWFAWLALKVLLLFPWFSLALSLPGMLTFRVEVRAPGAVLRGTRTETRLVGWCRLPVPPFRGKLRVTRLTTGESWRQTTDVPLPTDHCGGLLVKPEGTRVFDYLGLFGLPVRKKENATVIVRPAALPLGKLPELERFLARSWRPKFGGGYGENHELRLYRPGDSLNQVHWKLSAKTGKLILREPMQPERGLVLLTMNLRGDAPELDRKFGRLLWLGSHLLEREVRFQLRCLTGDGMRTWEIDTRQALEEAVDALLCSTPAPQGDLRERDFRASWQYHIGGEPDEA